VSDHTTLMIPVVCIQYAYGIPINIITIKKFEGLFLQTRPAIKRLKTVGQNRAFPEPDQYDIEATKRSKPEAYFQYVEDLDPRRQRRERADMNPEIKTPWLGARGGLL
jgi:hypothetical protein